MKIKTKSTVTVEMTGAEAQLLCEWMFAQDAQSEGGPVEQLYYTLRELPEEVER